MRISVMARCAATPSTIPEKKRITQQPRGARARELIWHTSIRLALGLMLMIVNRLLGLSIATSKIRNR